MLGEIFGVDGIVVLIVVLALLFGGAAIPKLARNLGSAKNQFTKGLEDGKKESSNPTVDSTGQTVAPTGAFTPTR
jgi:Sec-independent protein translocase protein TatA